MKMTINKLPHFRPISYYSNDLTEEQLRQLKAKQKQELRLKKLKKILNENEDNKDR